MYRLKEFFHEMDTELLLGTVIATELFCDHNLGRVLDKIFDTCAQAIFSQLSQNAVKRFGIDTRDVHSRQPGRDNAAAKTTHGCLPGVRDNSAPLRLRLPCHCGPLNR